MHPTTTIDSQVIQTACADFDEAQRRKAARQPTTPAPVKLTDADIHAWWASENGLEDCNMCDYHGFARVVRTVEQRVIANQVGAA